MSYLKEQKEKVNIDSSCFIAEGARLIGNVSLEKNSSVWYNAVLRADYDQITIGEGSNVQDCAVIHIDEGVPCRIGKNCTIGHQAMVHGCEVGDGSLIGIGAIVLNHVKIGKSCLIGANALVTEGTVIPDGSLVLGSPAKVIRALRADEIEGIQNGVRIYQEQAKKYLD